jgi:predicted Zn-dependent peptidase
LGVAPDKGAEALALVRRELEDLVRRGPDAEEVAAARRHLRGSILIGAESVSGHMYHLAHEEMYAEHYSTQEDQVARVEAVTVEDVVNAARTFLPPEGFSLTALGPKGVSLDWPVQS